MDDSHEDSQTSRSSASMPRMSRSDGEEETLPTDSMVTIDLSQSRPESKHLSRMPSDLSSYDDAVDADDAEDAEDAEDRRDSKHTISLDAQDDGSDDADDEETDKVTSNSPSGNSTPVSEAHVEGRVTATSMPEDTATLGDESQNGAYSDQGTPLGIQMVDNEKELSRRSSHSSQQSTGSEVNWSDLEREEKHAPREPGTDDATAFLLARLEQENNAIAADPKASIVSSRSSRRQSRPPSLSKLKRIVANPGPQSIRYSELPSPPPMTDLEFYAALVADFPRTAQRLPTLLSKKIRAGVPPPLRGMVWISIAGARQPRLEERYDELVEEPTPYENMIVKDLGRTFPGIDMFRDPQGDGQLMLGRVLRCFSLYDEEIGYCQGLGLLVCPLLMHMNERDAFCVLIRLMEHYDLRSCFLPEMPGLHLRIYQLQQLIAQHRPALAAHFQNLNVEIGAFAAQWFLSFFAVTCPLPMLLRIYDVVFAEGASETLMRVSLSLLGRNERKLLSCTEFGDTLQMLLSRAMWDTYAFNADELVNDFVGLSEVITRDALQKLEADFRRTQQTDSTARSLQTAASRFLGRLWPGSTKETQLSPTNGEEPRSAGPLSKRSASKQSLTSTINSVDMESESGLSTLTTEASTASRKSSADYRNQKLSGQIGAENVPLLNLQNENKELNRQIEELLTVMGDLQKNLAAATSDLDDMRDQRTAEKFLVQALVKKLKDEKVVQTLKELKELAQDDDSEEQTEVEDEKVLDFDTIIGSAGDATVRRELVFQQNLSTLMSTADERFGEPIAWRLSEPSALQRDNDDLKAKLHSERVRGQDLQRQVLEQENEINSLRDVARQYRTQANDLQRQNRRLERSVNDLQANRMIPAAQVSNEIAEIRERASSIIAIERANSIAMGPGESLPHRLSISYGGTGVGKRSSSVSGGPLGRGPPSPTHSRNWSKASMATVEEDPLVDQLVKAKTAEATAKQEAEEARAQLEQFKKKVGKNVSLALTPPTEHPPLTQTEGSSGSGFAGYLNPVSSNGDPHARKGSVAAMAAESFGRWTGWGRKSSTSAVPAT